MDITSLLDRLNLFESFNILNKPFPILVYLIAAWGAIQIPYIGGYLSLPNSLLNRVIQRILTKGSINKITLLKKSKNSSIHREYHPFKKSLITYVAYSGESLAAIGLFYLVSNHHYLFIFYLFIGLFIITVILAIRHIFIALWAMSFPILLSLPIYFEQTVIIMHVSIFLTALLFIQSIINSIKLCRKNLLDRSNSERSGFVGRLKWIPVMLLGMVLLSQSLYTGYFISRNILSFL